MTNTGKKISEKKTKQLISDGAEAIKIRQIGLSVDCVIFGFYENKLKVLLFKTGYKEFLGKWALLGDLIDPGEELEGAAIRILKDRTGLDNVYMEQVKTFGAIERHPSGRVVTVAYYSLLNIQNHNLKNLSSEVHWHDVHDIGELAFDHKLILDTCYEQLQKRVLEHPLAFSLLPKKFSMRELQNVYEAILNIKLDRRNFRKKFFSMDFLVDLNEMEKNVPHRPGKLYQFNYSKYEKRRKKWIGIDF